MPEIISNRQLIKYKGFFDNSIVGAWGRRHLGSVN